MNTPTKSHWSHRFWSACSETEGWISIHLLSLLANQPREFAIQQQDVKEPNVFTALWSWVIWTNSEVKGGWKTALFIRNRSEGLRLVCSDLILIRFEFDACGQLINHPDRHGKQPSGGSLSSVLPRASRGHYFPLFKIVDVFYISDLTVHSKITVMLLSSHHLSTLKRRAPEPCWTANQIHPAWHRKKWHMHSGHPESTGLPEKSSRAGPGTTSSNSSQLPMFPVKSP